MEHKPSSQKEPSDPDHGHAHERGHGIHTTVGQLDPSQYCDYVNYTLTLTYQISGNQKVFGANALSVAVANSGYGYAKGQEYWDASIWSYFDNPSDALASLVFTATKSMWKNTSQNPLSGTIVSAGSAYVSWVLQGKSLPAGLWLYAPAAGTMPAAAISLVNTNGVLSVAWGILAATAPAVGTYVVSVDGRAFLPTAPAMGSNLWWVPG